MTLTPHDRNLAFECAGCAAEKGRRVEWPNGCIEAQRELHRLYPEQDALLMHLMVQAVVMGRETELPPARVILRLTRWTGWFDDDQFPDLVLPTQRVWGAPASGAVPRPHPGLGLTSPRG